MVKLTFILIGIFIIIHFTLYYWNIDPFYLYISNKPIIEELKQVVNEPVHEDENKETYVFDYLKNNLEESLNELKQYNINNINE